MRYRNRMSTIRILTAFFCLTALAPTASAQSRDMDPDVKSYKLSMEKIKAYDVVAHKLMALDASDPSFKGTVSQIGTQTTLKGMVGAVESNPKLMAIIKSANLSAREFCVIPMGVMAVGGAYMIQTQYKKDASNLATPENIAFYQKNKADIDRIAKTWAGPSGK